MQQKQENVLKLNIGGRTMLKILHTSDWHTKDGNIEESEKCLSFLVETAKKEIPDLIVHSGDVFDNQNVQLDSMAAKLVFKVFAELADIAPTIAILGTRSHEGASLEVFSHIKARFPIYVSSKPEQVYLCEGDLNSDPAKLFAPDQAPIEAVISTLPAPTKQHWNSSSSINETDAEIGAAISGIFAGFGAKAAEYYCCPHILVMHCTIRGAMLSEKVAMVGRDIEVGIDQIQLANPTLACCGHIHKVQKCANNIFYSGSLFQQDTSEFNQNFGFWIHTIDPATGLHESEYHITPFTRLLKLTYDLTNPQADFKLPFTLEQLNNVRDAAVKVEIKVYEDEVTKIDREGLERNLSEAKSYDIRRIRCPRENVRSENILKLTTLREKLTEMARLKNEEVPESILTKADALESMEGDEIVKNAATCR